MRLRETKEALHAANAEVDQLQKQLAMQAKLAGFTTKKAPEPTTSPQPVPPTPETSPALPTMGDPAPEVTKPHDDHHEEAHVCKTLQKTKAVDFVKQNLAKRWGRK